MFDPKKAGEEADRLISELNQPETQVEDQQGDGEAITTQDIDTTQSTTEVAAQQTPQEPQHDNVALTELKKQLDAAEQRWKVLQGMIDKKDSEIDSMRVLFAQMQQAPVKEDSDGGPAYTDEDVEHFSDVPALAERIATRVAERVVRAELAKLKPSMDRVEQSVASVQQSTEDMAYDKFTNTLAGRVADWEQLNTDPGFLNWLNQEDGFTGVPRMALLREAFGKLQANRVARFFESYKDEAGLTKSEPAPATKPTADVKQFTAPPKSKSTPSTVDPSSAKQWSRADISKLYDDKMRGRITPQKFEELERDLFKAQRDGRVAA